MFYVFISINGYIEEIKVLTLKYVINVIKLDNMENGKQSAVEWFNEEINKLNVGTDARVFIAKLFEQAKEMEKEQICNAYRVGWINYSPKTDSEQYYNETFKTETIVTEYRDGSVKVETFKSE
jgi:hypothetical protein